MTRTLVQEARDYQVTAADPDLSVFVTANAGSGKTTTLVDRVARLLLRRVKPGEILCVTYTKAAAAEMQARLFEKLGEWAVADDRELARSLAALDGRDPATLTAADLSEARQLFANALETPGGLKIQTIHAFCEKLLKRFPLEAGVSPSFRVLENEAAIALSHGAREDLARAAMADPHGPVGQAYSHFAVELDWGSFHDLLGKVEAERGKLTAYVAAVAAGTAAGPYQLAEADPNQTPDDIEADFLDWIDGAQWESVAAAMATGSANDQKVAACMDAVVPGAWSVAAMAPVFLTQAGEPRKSMGTKKAPPAAVEFLVDLQLKYLSVRDVLRAAKVADDTIKALTLASAHASFYESAKRRQGALDFSDLVVKTVELLTKKASAAWVLFKLDGGIEHVLIDEAQDTAPDQWEIFKALTEEFFVGSGSERREPARADTPARSVFVVGDQKQSIYSFQGARPERLLKEAQAYASSITAALGADAYRQVPLATSFRSTEEVLQFVDAAFASPVRTRALAGDQGDTIAHAGARNGQHGSVDVWPLFEDPEASDRPAWNAPVDKESTFSGRKRLAQALAREIRRQVDAGVAVHARDETGPILRPARFGDFLILVRRRDATFEEIIRALKTEGVPVAGADRLKLSSHIVFDDLIAVARFVLYPDDDLGLAEILRSPLCDISDFGDPSSLYPLADAEARGGRSLWRTLNQRADEHPEWRRARDLLQAALDDRDRDPFAFFAGVLNRVDETGQSARARILTRLGVEAEEAIDETLAQVLAAEDRGGVDLETCLALLEAADVEVKREMEGARNEVRVMTVHGAKGLEAPIVILPDTTSRAKPMGPTLMPVALGDDPDDGEGWLMCPGRAGDDCTASAAARQARIDRTDAESLRLLYVALTRARDRVVVMGRALTRPATGFEEGSWWEVVADTLERLKEARPDAVREIGDGVVRFGVDPGTAPATAASETAVAAVPDWARRAPEAAIGVRMASPSQMDEALRIPAPSPLAVASAGPGKPLGRFRRGDLIHRLLERLPEIPAEARPDAAVRMLSRERDLDEAQRREMIDAAFAVLNDDRFAPVFGEGSRAEVALTGSAPGLPRGVSISGRIDRLVITPERVLVVDYKSNRPAPATIEAADPAYVLQLAVYAAVLKRLYPERAVEAALVWTDGPRLMAVPAEMMDAALANAR